MHSVILPIVLFIGSANAADIPPKERVLNRVIKSSFARTLEKVVSEMPEKYQLEISTREMGEITAVTIKGDHFAVKVIANLLALQVGVQQTRGEYLKEVAQLRKNPFRIEVYFNDERGKLIRYVSFVGEQNEAELLRRKLALNQFEDIERRRSHDRIRLHVLDSPETTEKVFVLADAHGFHLAAEKRFAN